MDFYYLNFFIAFLLKKQKKNNFVSKKLKKKWDKNKKTKEISL